LLVCDGWNSDDSAEAQENQNSEEKQPEEELKTQTVHEKV